MLEFPSYFEKNKMTQKNQPKETYMLHHNVSLEVMFLIHHTTLSHHLLKKTMDKCY